MLVIPFTDEDIAQLRYLRLNYPHPRVRQKIDAVYLKALGYPHHEIARFLNVTETTVRSYLKEYAEGGLDAVLRFEVGGSVSALEPHRTSITEEFERNPPASAREAAARIESLTGLHRSPSQVRVLLKHLGLKYRKVAPIPAKADPAAQERFLSEQLDPILAQAQAGLVHVFFMDAAHFVFGAFLGYLWCVTRIFVPTPSGRQRFNVLGAVHAITKEVVTFTNTGYINSQSVVALLQQLKQKFGDRPITIVLDNARYQRNAYVFAEAATLGIQLLFLPPYSPNLNLIERLWKFTKAECLNSRYYETFSQFCQAIETCLTQPTDEQKARLKTLLTLKFQRFPTKAA